MLTTSIRWPGIWGSGFEIAVTEFALGVGMRTITSYRDLEAWRSIEACSARQNRSDEFARNPRRASPARTRAQSFSQLMPLERE